jgi:glutamate dehydrogenase/leucine dehydrogenase
MLVVQIHTLATTDAFIVFDLDDAPGAGIVRSAPKILVDGATSLARTLTYKFATFERRIGGASAGINAKPDVRPAAVAAFAAEATDLVGAGRLLVEAGRGVAADDLAAVRAVDPRPEAYWTRHDELTALGVAVAAEAVLDGLAGRSVAIEGFDASGPLLAAELVARGAKVTAVATSEGTVAATAGLDVPALALAWAEHGPACVRELGLETGAPSAVFATPADVLVAGSKPGIVDDEVAAGLEVRAVVPGGPVPVTAKALAVLRRADTLVLPDFVTTAGPLFAGWPADSAADPAPVAADAIAGSVREVMGHEDGPLLGACYRAEAFLSGWRDELPFGRPLA